MENKLMYVVRSRYDQFTHRVGSIAKKMQCGDGFATHGVMLTVERCGYQFEK